MKNNHILILLFIVIIAGCAKYEDGGKKSQSKVNIDGIWKLSSYLKNAKPTSGELKLLELRDTYQAGAYIRNSRKQDQSLQDVMGTYGFDGDKNLLIDGVDSLYGLSDENPAVFANKYEILKLTETELRYQFKSGNDYHEFRFDKMD